MSLLGESRRKTRSYYELLVFEIIISLKEVVLLCPLHIEISKGAYKNQGRRLHSN